VGTWHAGGLFVLCAAIAAGAACDEPDGAEEAERGDRAELPAAATEPFREVDDATLHGEIEAARRRAQERGARVLLDFVAPWCEDCREVIRVMGREPAASVLRERYELVYVNVGSWDRAEALRERHRVRVITKLVVLEPDGEVVASTTLEPISRREELTPDELAAWLRDPG